MLYAMAGQFARARRLAPVDSGPDLSQFGVRTALEAAFQLGRGRYEDAAARFREASAAAEGPFWLPELALAYDRAGEKDSALAVYQRYLDNSYTYRIIFDAARLAPSLRRTAELYEARGDRPHALERYRQLADLWRNADPRLAREVAEVKRRIAELSGEAR
jgi:tetratricopeptide (TPR) repeat protein